MADKALKGHGLGSRSLADAAGIELAARQDLGFDCPNGHHFTLTCAAEAGLKELYSSDRHLVAAAPHFGLQPVTL